jgi:imidazolonepropionase-like amidohydrolase
MQSTNLIAITGGTLIDGTGAQPLPNANVVIRAGRIEAVGPALDVSIPDGATVYDSPGKTVMPGLIDGHVHLRSNVTGKGRANFLWMATTFIEEQTLHCAGNARIALEAGVTTVRDMAGGRPEVSAKRAIDDGVLPGARVVAAGFVGMTAGHGDLFCPAGIAQRFWPEADGVDECRKLVRRYARDGLDLIKVCTSGGVLSTGDKNEWRNYTLEETLAIVDEAHALGMKVAVHAHTRAGILQALDAGVDTIEHGSSLDDELIELMLKAGVMLCPTLAIVEHVLAHGREAGVPEESLDKGRRLREHSVEGYRKAYAAGVPMFMGTDSCMALPFGAHARELSLMHELIGLSPMETITASTGKAAQALGLDDQTGTFAPGMLADLLVVDGDPLSDLTILEDPSNILAVFQSGDLKVDRGLYVRARERVGSG